MSKRRQRGFVLITALSLSILYFALMELMLIDSSRALAEAQRFRAHVVAQALAENGAELAAFQMIVRNSNSVKANDFQGSTSGELKRSSNSFTLQGEGTSIGALKQRSTVMLQGRIDPATNQIAIDYAVHGD